MTDEMQPVQPKGKAVLAAESIREFVENNCSPGDRIPSVRKLEKMLDVSRMTVCSALSALVSQGLIRAEHGRGYFVQEPEIIRPRRTSVIAVVYRSGLKKGHQLGIEYRIIRHIEGMQSVCPDMHFRLMPYPREQLFETYSMDEINSFSGVVFCTGGIYHTDPRFNKLRVPSVAFKTDPLKSGKISGFVNLDIHGSWKKIFSHLKNLGHEKIGCVFYGAPIRAEAAYREVFGIPIDRSLCYSVWDENRIPDFDRIDRLFEKGLDATAYVVADEFISNRFIDCASRSGINIPQDVSLAALYYPHGIFDTGGLTVTALSSILLAYEMGKKGGEVFQMILSGAHDKPVTRTLRPEIKIGNTTAFARREKSAGRA